MGLDRRCPSTAPTRTTPARIRRVRSRPRSLAERRLREPAGRAGRSRTRRRTRARSRLPAADRRVPKWPSVQHLQLQLVDRKQLDAFLLQLLVESGRFLADDRDGISQQVKFGADADDRADLAIDAGL